MIASTLTVYWCVMNVLQALTHRAVCSPSYCGVSLYIGPCRRLFWPIEHVESAMQALGVQSHSERRISARGEKQN